MRARDFVGPVHRHLAMPNLFDIVAQIKADGARISPAAVLARVKEHAEFADVSLSQVRRAISNVPKVDAEIKAKRRAEKEREREAKRVRTGRARPAETKAREAALAAQIRAAAETQMRADSVVVDSLERTATQAQEWHERAAAIATSLRGSFPTVAAARLIVVDSTVQLVLTGEQPPAALYIRPRAEASPASAARLMRMKVPVQVNQASKPFSLMDCLGVYFLDGCVNERPAYRRTMGVYLPGEETPHCGVWPLLRGHVPISYDTCWPLAQAISGRGYFGRDPHLTWVNGAWCIQIGQAYRSRAGTEDPFFGGVDRVVCRLHDACISPHLSRESWQRCEAVERPWRDEPDIECIALTASDAVSAARDHFAADVVWRLNAHAKASSPARSVQWRGLTLRTRPEGVPLSAR